MYVDFFFESVNRDPVPDVTVAERKLYVVHEYLYSGILLDSQLTFKSQVKKE